MKNKFVGIIMLLSVVLLTACGNNTDTTKDSSSKSSTTKIDKKAKKTKQSVNGVLTKVGQTTISDQVGAMELEKISLHDEKPIVVNGISYTLKNTKLFKVTPDNKAQIDYVNSLFNKSIQSGESFHYLQVTYDITNDTDKEVTSMGLKNIVLSDRTQLDSTSGLVVKMNQISPKARLNTFNSIFIQKDKLKFVDKMTYNFDHLFNTSDGKTVAENFPAIEVRLDK